MWIAESGVFFLTPDPGLRTADFFHSFFDRPFLPALAGQVITPLPQGVGQVLLVDHGAFIVMGVLVALAVS